MKLRIILGLENEIEDALEKYIEAYEVRVFGDREALKEYLNMSAAFSRELLLIAATDDTIALARRHGIAVMAYENPHMPHQTYSGVDMIVEGFEEVEAGFLEKVYQRYHHIPWKIAQTKRTVIRELELNDIDKLFELYADGEICKYTEDLYPYEEEMEFQRAYIEHMYRFYGYGMWLVFSKETGELIGRAGLEHREYNEETELELGYVIGTKYQRQGYATEVCQAVLNIATEITDFSRINCLIEKENKASVGLAEKLGFSHMEDMELDGKRMSRYILNF